MASTNTVLTIGFTIICSNLFSDSDRSEDTERDVTSGAKQLYVVIAIVLCDDGLRRRLCAAEGDS